MKFFRGTGHEIFGTVTEMIGVCSWLKFLIRLTRKKLHGWYNNLSYTGWGGGGVMVFYWLTSIKMSRWKEAHSFLFSSSHSCCTWLSRPFHEGKFYVVGSAQSIWPQAITWESLACRISLSLEVTFYLHPQLCPNF